MTVSSTQNSQNAQNAYTASTASMRTPQQALGQAEFFKLIAVQLKNQDPMKPMDDTAFLAQMAQFNSLEQASAMATDIRAMRAESQLTAATSTLGREVTLIDDKTEITGVVDSVEIVNGYVAVRVNDTLYLYDQVVRVAPAPVPPPASEPSESETPAS
jgi:flagellar basal-body rod modification protein FlgD